MLCCPPTSSICSCLQALKDLQEALDANEGDKKKVCQAVQAWRSCWGPRSSAALMRSGACAPGCWQCAMWLWCYSLQALRCLKKTRMQLDELTEELSQVGPLFWFLFGSSLRLWCFLRCQRL